MQSETGKIGTGPQLSPCNASKPGTSGRGEPLRAVLRPPPDFPWHRCVMVGMSIFVATIFLSAFLLFSVQPILGKLLLPHLGGSPAVWITTMMVYQGLLLAGYAYAHLMRDKLGGSLHVRGHLFLLAGSLLTMPLILVTPGWADPTTQPALWLVLALLATVGLPFFLLSANAPLIQAWFAASGHAHAANPYFLYSASNLGSFIALISYPLLVERFLGTTVQLSLWSWGYCLFVALIGVTAIKLLRQGRMDTATRQVPPSAGENDTAPGQPPTIRDKLHWLALAFVPSSLLLGVTHYLTTDIAAFPLLWVIPLALYLLTFVVAFSRFNEAILGNTLNLQLFFLLAAVFTLAIHWTDSGVFLLHLGAFFIIAYVCHGQLAASRPHALYLTEFYLWISVGGVVGGIFNAIAAPLLFTEIWEYPLALLAAAFLRPAMKASSEGTARIPWPRVKDTVQALTLGTAAIAIFWLTIRYGDPKYFNIIMSTVFLVLFGLIFSLARRHPLRLLAILAAPLLGAGSFIDDGNALYKSRNFFGTLEVRHDTKGNFNKLVHGTTVHGLQSLDPNDRLSPTAYYKPLAEIFAVPGQKREGAPVALVGLGVGTAVCFGQPGQQFDIFEINPAVVRVATNPEFFRYLSDCPPRKHTNIILGDARLSMVDVKNGKYGLIILDAYNSDSLPVHLITREAMVMYLQKLKPDGILALHISNKHLDIRPVVQALAQDLNLYLAFNMTDDDGELQLRSAWAVLTRKDQPGRPLAHLSDKWKPLPSTTVKVWTDDYSNIIGRLK